MSGQAVSTRPWVVLVGGFLGAGKTTLILAAARELQRRGLRSAMVWNDQGKDLVDSRYAALSGMRSGEVTGGCFCCRLSELIDAMGELRAHAPDVIFAEPVGSCTDLSATVLRPLLEYSDTYQLSPLTVLVDPLRARRMLEPDADADMRFLFDKQLQEADLVCFTKSDLYPEYPETAAPHVRQLSAKSGHGVAAWLNEVLSGTIATGDQALEIDYSEYARAEAALAWLNLRAVFEPRNLLSPAMLLGPFARPSRCRPHRRANPHRPSESNRHLANRLSQGSNLRKRAGTNRRWRPGRLACGQAGAIAQSPRGGRAGPGAHHR